MPISGASPAARRSPGRPIPAFLAVLLLVAAQGRAGADNTIKSQDPDPTRADPFLLAQRTRLLGRLGVPGWHQAGSRGQGVKVAILDTGFRGYRAQLGRALPPRVTARSFRADGNLEARDSQHGILCGEVVHALAPDADLLFANWEPDRPDQFLDAVRWARDQGARVVSCSVIMPSWSDGEGRGPVHEALARVVGQGQDPRDLLCFASAGNTAQRHGAGPCRPRADGYHQWGQGIVDNPLTPWGDEPVSVELCGPADAGFRLEVYDAITGTPVPGRSGPRGTSACAVVRFDPDPGRAYLLRVRGRDGAAFHLVALGAGLGYATARGSIPFPGDGPEVIAVGAVTAAGERAEYSSCGPNSSQPKPDLVAVVPFPSLWRPRPFSGTSAAAPQAAALAALLWSRHPRWSAAEVHDALVHTARDLADPGHDFQTGYGLIALPQP